MQAAAKVHEVARSDLAAGEVETMLVAITRMIATLRARMPFWPSSPWPARADPAGQGSGASEGRLVRVRA